MHRLGSGARQIDNFWIAPAEKFTENYVSWHAREQFRTLAEAIYDSAAAEKLQADGQVRPARVAVVLSAPVNTEVLSLLARPLSLKVSIGRGAP